MKEATSIYYPPGPVHKLPLSLFLNFLRNPIEVLNDISRYGDISHFKFGTQHVYFLNHPDYIRDVLVTYNNNFIKSRGLQLAIHDCKIGKYTIPAGSTILMSQYLMHRDKRFFLEPQRHKNKFAEV
jgi:cytochrome P450